MTSSANGSQGSSGSDYVSINFSSEGFTSVVATTTSPAFEFASIASATTAVPVTAGQTGTPITATATDTVTNTLLCFLRGTRITTVAGEVAIEDLHARYHAGDLREQDRVVTTIDGAPATLPIRWMGRRHVGQRDIARIGDHPARLRRDAVAPGIPRHDLLVTPEHCVFVQGRLIPARMLVNDRSIVQDRSIDERSPPRGSHARRDPSAAARRPRFSGPGSPALELRSRPPAGSTTGWRGVAAMNVLMIAIVTVAGALTVVQSGANAQLVRSIEHPWLVGTLVSVVTAAIFALVLLATSQPLPQGARIASAPWWAWTGGACGAIYVISTLFFAQKLGSGLFTGLTITAGIVTSILIDHFGLIGFKQHTAGLWRIAGAALMIAGLGLVARF